MAECHQDPSTSEESANKRKQRTPVGRHEIQKDALLTLHQSNATVLQEFERIVLRNISDWAQYAKKLRDKAEDISKMWGISNSIESVLQEDKRTQKNPVEAELVSPGMFIDLLKSVFLGILSKSILFFLVNIMNKNIKPSNNISIRRLLL